MSTSFSARAADAANWHCARGKRFQFFKFLSSPFLLCVGYEKECMHIRIKINTLIKKKVQWPRWNSNPHRFSSMGARTRSRPLDQRGTNRSGSPFGRKAATFVVLFPNLTSRIVQLAIMLSSFYRTWRYLAPSAVNFFFFSRNLTCTASRPQKWRHHSHLLSYYRRNSLQRFYYARHASRTVSALCLPIKITMPAPWQFVLFRSGRASCTAIN